MASAFENLCGPGKPLKAEREGELGVTVELLEELMAICRRLAGTHLCHMDQ